MCHPKDLTTESKFINFVSQVLGIYGIFLNYCRKETVCSEDSSYKEQVVQALMSKLTEKGHNLHID